MKDPVYITGMGCLTSAGDTPAALWKSVLEGRSGIRDGVGYIDRGFPRDNPKPLALAYAAIDQAILDAGWDGLHDDDGIVLATTTGLVPLWEPDLMRFLGGEIPDHELLETFRHEPLGTMLQAIRERYRFRGEAELITTACSASTHALAIALRWLRRRKVRRVLVGGSETLSRLTLDGFRAFQLLTTDTATPFDKDRKGINLADGAGFLCLELDRGERPVARLSGGGFSNDAYHMTAPHPEGAGCLAAMRAALDDAELTPIAIDWVHAHGTGSPHNDLAEGTAIRTLFDGHGTPWVSSTKGIHGHALAATGAIETILCCLALREGIVLPTHGLKNPDPGIPLRHPREKTRHSLRHVLKSTLGFGGSNGALVLSRVEGTA